MNDLTAFLVVVVGPCCLGAMAAIITGRVDRRRSDRNATR